MPCACLLPPEIYPDASEWGPILWSILHAIAEKAGKTPFPMYREDERRALLKFFVSLGKTIPCPSCKDHFDSYLRENPVEKDLKEMAYSDIGPYVKLWFWELHNWVNESYKKPTFPYEALTPTYKGVNIRQRLKDLDIPMNRAIRVRGGQLLAYTEFTKNTLMLLSIYGC